MKELCVRADRVKCVCALNQIAGGGLVSVRSCRVQQMLFVALRAIVVES